MNNSAVLLFFYLTTNLTIHRRKESNMTFSKEIIQSQPAAGYTVVLGTAGSGKTAAALQRACYLAEQPSRPNVLLLTWNRQLAMQMKAMRDTLPDRLTVECLSDFALRCLKRRGVLTGMRRVLDESGRIGYIGKALRYCQAAHPDEPLFFMHEKRCAALIHAIRHRISLPDGMAEPERGRLRGCMEIVQHKYLELRTFDGWRFDYDDLAELLGRQDARAQCPLRYSHIVADEAQDFSPLMLHGLLGVLKPEGSLTLFMDPDRQLSGGICHFRFAGLPVGQLLKMEQNLRSPAAGFALMQAIRAEMRRNDAADVLTPYSEKEPADCPPLHRYDNIADEIAAVTELAAARSRSDSAAVLLRNADAVLRYQQALSEKNVSAEILRIDKPMKIAGKGMYLGTYAAARGLTFSQVFLPELSAERIPDPAQRVCMLNDADWQEYERRLLYLAAGRASGALMLSCAGTPSPLLPECLRRGGA